MGVTPRGFASVNSCEDEVSLSEDDWDDSDPSEGVVGALIVPDSSVYNTSG